MAREAQLTKQLPVALAPQMYDEIEALADEMKISKGDVVRRAVAAGLPQVKP